MEEQMQRPTHGHHHYEEDPPNDTGSQSVMEGEGEGEHNHHGEKKSVLKKVKDKAKKIKDNIKKHGGHGHDHDHEHDYRHDQISEEEEDDDGDEETVNARGAPKYESAFISGTALPKQTAIDLEKPAGPPPDMYNFNVTNQVYPNVGDDGGVTKTSAFPEDSYNPNARDEVYPDVGGALAVNKSTSPLDDGYKPDTGREIYQDAGDGRGVTNTAGLAENRYDPSVRSEVHPDVTDGKGGTKASGLIEDMYNPNVRSRVYPDVGNGRGTTKASGLLEDRYNPNIGNEVCPDVGDAATRTSGLGEIGTELGRSPVEAEPPHSEVKNPLVAVPAAMELEEASAAQPVVKVGPLVGLEEDPHSPKNHPWEIPPSNYQAKVVDPTGEGGKEAEVAPIVRSLDDLCIRDKSESDPASEQGSYTGSHDQFAPQSTPTTEQLNLESNPVDVSENTGLPKSYDPARPESMPRDTVAGKISSAKSVITDKAVSAKNVVASKLGYLSQHQEEEDSSKKPASESVMEYGYKIAGKLTPVYEKVAGAGSAIMSKVQRSGVAEHEGSRDTLAKGTTTDKGISVKEYLAEKLSPGEEDKALSEAITDTIHRKKEGIWKTGQGKESGDVAPPRLGTGKERERDATAERYELEAWQE